MKFARAALFASAAVIASPAYAGEQVLYADLPGWVEEATIEPLLVPEAPAELLYDWQYRLEDGVVYEYTDHAVRFDNPQALMQRGSLALSWLPDKGDLTVHRLEILRDGDVIDLLERGVQFDVLRRELGLEWRLIDGVLTASLVVPGLKEKDVLRVAYTVSVDDQALGDEVQATQFLPADPWNVGLARAIVSWPADEQMYWDVEDRITLDEPEVRGGYKYLRVDLPVSERPPVPRDAPTRFRRPEVLRVTSFSGWQDLSAVMAPHFEAAAEVEADSQVAAQAQRIMDATSDPLERIAMATRLVQDEVSYMLNGLDGGNYLPQDAEYTWEARFGDCKAKSVLLLSLLRQMEIDSEAVLVVSQGGDALPELLPQPADFDHVIVHAVIDGTDYWLDGTSAATRISNIADVPPFYYALPLRPGGSDLIPMAQRDLATPQAVIASTFDHSAGIDFPLLFTIDMTISGAGGAQLQAMADAADPNLLRQLGQTFGTRGVSGARVSGIDVDYDKEAAVGRLHITGVASSMFQWDGEDMVMDVETGADVENFNPDRARPSWRTIPVATPGPGRQRFSSSVILPDGGRGYTLSGDTSFSGGFGNMRIVRAARIEDGVLHAESESFLGLGEIPSDQLAEAKLAARRIETSAIELTPPATATWRWDLDETERKARAEPILAAFDDAIAFAAPEDYGPLQSRAAFLLSIYEFEAALADFDELVEKTPSTWAYMSRSNAHEALGHREQAIADLQAAYDLDPQNGIGYELARKMAYEGRLDDANALLDGLPVGEEDRVTFADVLATVSGLQGDPAGGYDVLALEVLDKPNNAQALNADCWYRGLFNVELDNALDQCTRAVERAANSAPALDSRALVRFRLGQLDQAISDLDAALEVAPGLAPSMYLRGVIRLMAGDSSGRRDIEIALRMSPQLEQFYARHGINPPV